MTTIINAVASTGLVQTSDGSGVMSVYWLRCAEHTDIFKQGYIGITKYGREKRRFWEHKTVGQNAHLRNALNKYEVVQEILLIANKDYCKEIEQKLRPETNIGWNIVAGGGLPPSFKGKKRSVEFVKRLKQQVQSEETKAKRSTSMLGNKNGVGHKLTEKHKELLSNAMKGTKRCLGKQNNLKYRYIGTNIKTGEIITLVGGKPVENAGFHMGHVSSCACGTEKSHKGYTWTKELINGINN